eukprot:8336240-Ditylum_brightwellii.AAC.1
MPSSALNAISYLTHCLMSSSHPSSVLSCMPSSMLSSHPSSMPWSVPSFLLPSEASPMSSSMPSTAHLIQACCHL